MLLYIRSQSQLCIEPAEVIGRHVKQYVPKSIVLQKLCTEVYFNRLLSFAAETSSQMRGLALIIRAPRCDSTVCRTHLRLDAECDSHCDGNYVCIQILGAHISS